MAKDEKRSQKDDHVHQQIQALRRKVKGRAVDAPGSRVLGSPLRLEGNAADHLDDQNGDVARRQEGDDCKAQTLLPGQDGDAVVLEHDGQLEEEVRQGVKLNDADSDLRVGLAYAPASGRLLYVPLIGP